MLTITPIAPAIAARVTGLDIGAGITPAEAAALREALACHQVLVISGQNVTDETQIAFSEEFGALEETRAGADGAGSKVIVLTNVGRDGGIAAPSARQVLNGRANQAWHHDSSFKPVPARVSILSAREIPSSGGNTEFASMRAVLAALDPAEQERLRGLVAVHDFAWSRRLVDPALVSEAEAAEHPPVRQKVVHDENPHGPALYLGAHARAIEGMDATEGRALIDRLVAFAGEAGFAYSHRWASDDVLVWDNRAGFVYSHRWASGDVLMWDNRAVMHRATPFADSGEPRRMVRTTVAG